jgi:SNF2 family DNA or RNA helicase|tara:strand:- start:959 stop:1618 length:660 start_codon:yes stop_codon:yes gene_type:complete
MYQTRDVEMTRQQKKYYKKLKDDLVIQAAGEEVTASNAAIAMNKLLQVSLGAIYTDNSNVLRFDVGSRYTVLKETIDESAKKVIVFVPYKNCIELVRELLTKDGITSEVISGDVPVGKRTEIFKRFQDTDDPRVLVVQPQAAAHGVTLTAANTIVWWGPTSSLEIYAQANARIHRAGQDTKCTIVQLRGSAVERRIYDMLDKRIDLHAELVNLYKDLLE